MKSAASFMLGDNNTCNVVIALITAVELVGDRFDLQKRDEQN